MSTDIVDLVKLIENGHFAQETVLKDCSNTFTSESSSSFGYFLNKFRRNSI